MDEERLLTVSTCALSITFPRSMGLLEYEEFKEKMDLVTFEFSHFVVLPVVREA